MGCAYLAVEDIDKAMDVAMEAKSIFEKLDNRIGIASCMNTIAQVHKHKKDTDEAIIAATEAHRLFEEEQDHAGAEVAAFLLESLRASEGDGQQESTANVDADEKKKEKPGKIESRSALGDLIHGGVVPSITVL